MRGARDAGPSGGAGRGKGVAAVIVVDVEVGLVGGGKQQHRVVHVPPSLVGVGVLRPGVEGVGPGEFLGGHVAGETQRLTGVIVVEIVPAID